MELLERYGGWPVVKGDDWQSNDWNWLEANKQMFKDGLVDDLILEFRIRTDFVDSSKRIIQVKNLIYQKNTQNNNQFNVCFDYVQILRSTEVHMVS